MIFLLLLSVFSYPQNTNSLKQNDDPKTLLWENSRMVTVKSDTKANHLNEPYDPSKDPKTEMWSKQRSEAVVNYPDSLYRNSNNTNPGTDTKSVLWEKNRLNKRARHDIDSKTDKLNPKLQKE
jgi:hypothetical protein